MASTPQQNQTEALAVRAQTSPLIIEMADTLKMQPKTMWDTIMRTVMPSDKPVTTEMVLAFLNVANTYKLNPFLKQIYAFPDKRGGIVPMVPIDGWIDLVQRHPKYDGYETTEEFEKILTPGPNNTMVESKGKIISCTTIMYRKDHSRPTKHTEYYSECRRDTEPWNKWPCRMLSHKSYIQCARKAFGFSGIYDEDEAERIVAAGGHGLVDAASIPQTGAPVVNISDKASADLKAKLTQQREGKTIEGSPEAPKVGTEPLSPEQSPAAAPEEDTPPPNTEDHPAAQQQEAPVQSESRTPEVMLAEFGEDNTVTGTLVEMTTPKRQANGMLMSVSFKSQDGKRIKLSVWDTKLQAFLIEHKAKGQVCTFVYQERGNFLHAANVLKIGAKERMRD